jgi:hypothetical protein
MLEWRDAITLLSLAALVGTGAQTDAWVRDPDVPCPEDHPECETDPPGPMPVVHARLGQEVTFHCYAYSPCARVVLDLDEPVDHVRVTLRSGLAGGYGADVTPPPDVDAQDGDVSYGAGYGFGPGGPEVFEHTVPFRSSEWTFSFSPLSGQHGADVRMVVTSVESQAPSGQAS